MDVFSVVRINDMRHAGKPVLCCSLFQDVESELVLFRLGGDDFVSRFVPLGALD